MNPDGTSQLFTFGEHRPIFQHHFMQRRPGILRKKARLKTLALGHCEKDEAMNERRLPVSYPTETVIAFRLQ